MNEKEQKIYAKYLAKMKKVPKDGDCEVNHSSADSLLTDLLVDLGMSEIVDEYDSIRKWYA